MFFGCHPKTCFEPCVKGKTNGDLAKIVDDFSNLDRYRGGRALQDVEEKWGRFPLLLPVAMAVLAPVVVLLLSRRREDRVRCRADRSRRRKINVIKEVRGHQQDWASRKPRIWLKARPRPSRKPWSKDEAGRSRHSSKAPGAKVELK